MGASASSPFGRLLRAHRVATGLSQEQLAERADLSLRGISDLERGARRAPRLETVRMLCEALSLSPDECVPLFRAARALEDEPPPGSGLRAAGPRRLPAPLVPLIGRDHEMAQIVALLRQPDGRLVTLTGAGGSGKTRLALAVAADVASDFDAIHVVELAQVAAPELVMAAIVTALGLQPAPGERLDDVAVRYLRPRRALLVLDNFEHLLAATPVVNELLAACLELTVLVTSRARLRLRGERECLIAPLALPARTRPTGVDDVAGAASVQLFVLLAQNSDPAFALTDTNAATIAEICRRLDGLPLAIELAASRVTVLTPSTLLARLEHRLPLLAGGPRDLPARLRTMRDAIAWSDDLLTSAEQVIFRRLAVFSGEFALDAIQPIVGDQEMTGGQVLDALTSLVEHSLVRQIATDGDQSRYLLLETIREYAQERLETSGDAAATRRRHAAYFLSRAERLDAGLLGRDQHQCMCAMERDLANFRSALVWAFDHDEADIGARLAAALFWFWRTHGDYEEAQAWLSRAIGVCDDPADTRLAPVLWAYGVLLSDLNDDAGARGYLERSLGLYRQHGNRRGAARAHISLGLAIEGQGDFSPARTQYDQALALAQAIDDPLLAGMALQNLARNREAQGDLALARRMLEESLTFMQRAGYRQGLGRTLHSLGMVVRTEGEIASASVYFTQSLAEFRALGYRRGAADVLVSLGWIAMNSGQVPEAADRFREALTIYRDLGVRRGIGTALEGCAGVAAAWGAAETALRLASAAEKLLTAKGAWPGIVESGGLHAWLQGAQRKLGQRRVVAAWSAGAALSIEQAAGEAFAVIDTLPPQTVVRQARALTPACGLTGREQMVLTLIAQGKTDQEIGNMLSISRRTVSTHVTGILTKLRVSNRVEAAAYAIRSNLN